MRVLIVEDEKEIRELITEALSVEGFDVLSLETGDSAFEMIDRYQPDAVLLDQILPGKNGVEVLRELKTNAKYARIGVLMVTGLTAEGEVVRALDVGADDYVTKPFMPRALAARVKAVVRRVRGAGEAKTDERLISGDLVVDFASHKVILEEQELALTLTEFKILSELLKESGRVLTRDKLRQKALGNLNVTDRTIDVHMASLRKKLSHKGEAIQTVRGVGYRFAH